MEIFIAPLADSTAKQRVSVAGGRGRQRLDGAWVDVVGRDDRAVHALRFRLDRPVAQYAFLFAAGCDVMEVIDGGEAHQQGQLRERSTVREADFAIGASATGRLYAAA